jgi:hypothetical protein
MTKLPKLPNPGSVLQARYTADQMREYAHRAVAAERADFDAYKEGSEEAFRTVVDDKHALQARVRQLEQTISSQQDVIYRLRQGGEA